MYSKDDLLDLKARGVKEVYHDGALLSGTPLKDHTYEIIHLESVTDDYLCYKALDLNSGNFVAIKEFFPKEAIGYDDVIYFERNFDSLELEVKNPLLKSLQDASDLMDSFIEEKKYREKMAINPPITKIIDDFRDYGTAYLVTTYNVWPSLECILEEDIKLDFATIDGWIRALIKQVIPFHKRGIVHRNINPSHIYIQDKGVTIEGIGSSSIFKDVKIIHSTPYESRYFAPEVNLAQGEIGPWSDVYAIGKIMIDLLIKFGSGKDYFNALEQIPQDNMRDKYGEGIKQAIAFKTDHRLQDIMGLAVLLNVEEKEKSILTPTRQVVAVIMTLAVISSSLVLWRYRAPVAETAGDYLVIEEEMTPLGSVREVFFLDENQKIFTYDDSMIQWAKKADARMLNLELVQDNTCLLKVKLKGKQNNFDLNAYNLTSGHYKVLLAYMYEENIFSISLDIEYIK